MNWKPSARFLAASAHLGWAAAVMLAAHVAGFDADLTFGFLCIAAAWKEFFLDILVIEQDTFLNSTLDFVTYLAGAGLGQLGTMDFLGGLMVSLVVLVIMAGVDYLAACNPED